MNLNDGVTRRAPVRAAFGLSGKQQLGNAEGATMPPRNVDQ
ncbi:hypothetical protein [Ensifer sp. 4252]